MCETSHGFFFRPSRAVHAEEPCLTSDSHSLTPHHPVNKTLTNPLPLPPTGRRRSDAHDPNSTTFISSQGPMILLQATEDPSGKFPKYSSEWKT